MFVNFQKLHPDARIPKYSKFGDAGLDLTAISHKLIYLDDIEFDEYGTGLAIEIPEGYVGLIFPRSSISTVNQFLTNSVGVIDSNYRGEIRFRFKRADMKLESYKYSVGDRVGQLIIIPYPQVKLIEVSELTSTNRGTDGFGSTGK